MCLGGGWSAAEVDDVVCCTPEEIAESEDRQCIPNRSEGGIEQIDDREWGERKASHQGKTTKDEHEEHECEDNVEDFFVGQFGWRSSSSGGGGGSRGSGKFLGNDWDGHRSEGNDDDEQIEARAEERVGEAAREGHDLVVCEIQEEG